MSLAEMQECIHHVVRRYGVKFVLLDHLQFMMPDQQISTISE